MSFSSSQDLRLDRHVQRGGRLVGDQQLAACRPAPWRSSRAGASRRRTGADSRARAAPALGICTSAQHLHRAPPAPALRDSLSCTRSDLADLVADRVDRVERGHRLLEHHGDLACADLVHLVRAAAGSGRGRATGSAPASKRPGGMSISFSTLRAVTVLPQPDSPTTASVSPRLTDEVDAIDRAHHAVVGLEPGLQIADVQQDFRHRPSQCASMFDPRVRTRQASDHPPRIERVAQAVADEIDGQHGKEDRQAGEQRPVRRDVADSPCASYSIRPQLGTSGGKPRPRKDSVDSAMIAFATSMVPATITGPSALGRMCRITSRAARGTQRAGRLDEFLFAQRQELRAHQACQRHPAQAADHRDDQQEDAALLADAPSASVGRNR